MCLKKRHKSQKVRNDHTSYKCIYYNKKCQGFKVAKNKKQGLKQGVPGAGLIANAWEDTSEQIMKKGYFLQYIRIYNTVDN